VSPSPSAESQTWETLSAGSATVRRSTLHGIGRALCALVLLTPTVAWAGGFADLPGELSCDSLSAERSGPDKRQLARSLPQAAQKLRGGLLELADRQMRLSSGAAEVYARTHRLPVQNGSVTVIAVPKSTYAPAQLAAAAAKLGATVVRTGKQAVKLKVPLSLLSRLAAEVPALDHVRLPARPRTYNTVISQGLLDDSGMNVQNWLAHGLDASGVKVAVIDLGFIGLSARQAEGELPASAVSVDFSGVGVETSTEHGVGVAEVVYDMAPRAELFLLKVDDEVDLDAAVNYCVANDIDVINHSVGWYGFNFFDGASYSSMQPSPVAIANTAAANGIVWVNAAGNDRLRHAFICWSDQDGDDWLDWTGSGAEINQIGTLDGGTVVVLQLTWNAWPTTDQDYDLYLWRWNGNKWLTVAQSQEWQTGTQPPIEGISFQVAQSAPYGFSILRDSADGTSCFIVRSFYQNVQFYGFDNDMTAAPGSIGCPADAESVLAVGAIRHSWYRTGPTESFSAIGPTNGAYTGQPVLTKPDVCGPDGNVSITYPGGFFGTSSASPHVAGAAALVWARFAGFDNQQVRTYLELEGINPDRGSPGKDDVFGYGPAVFRKVWYLTMAADPNDAGTTNPTVPGPHLRDDGEQVALSADALSGYVFDFWSSSGDPNALTGMNDSNAAVLMEQDTTVTANFRQAVCGDWGFRAADFTRDCRVDWRDFTIFAAYWLQSGCGQPDWCAGADLDHSGEVGWGDFSAFSSYWLACTDPQTGGCDDLTP